MQWVCFDVTCLKALEKARLKKWCIKLNYKLLMRSVVEFCAKYIPLPFKQMGTM